MTVPAGPANPVGPQAITHRGVRWRLYADGRIAWYNEGREQWVRWRPRSDAPPLPPEWASLGSSTAAAAPQPRAGWRSPYRIVPIVLAVAIIAIGIVQAARPGPSQAKAESKAAAKLLGTCLRQDGVTGGHPRYASGPVPCSAPNASVKVVSVLPGTPGAPSCPDGQSSVQLAYPGVRYPHVECVVALQPTG
jgi:hypothetical protein